MKVTALLLPTVLCLFVGCRNTDPQTPALPEAPPRPDTSAPTEDRQERRPVTVIETKADLDSLLNRGMSASLRIGGPDGGVAVSYSDGSNCAIVPIGRNHFNLVLQDGANSSTREIYMTDDIYMGWMNAGFANLRLPNGAPLNVRVLRSGE